MTQEFQEGKELIDQLGKYGFKCYIEKGTGRSEINRQEKVVIIDICLKNFREQAALAVKLASAAAKREGMMITQN